jgi:hypothetical protein
MDDNKRKQIKLETQLRKLGKKVVYENIPSKFKPSLTFTFDLVTEAEENKILKYLDNNKVQYDFNALGNKRIITLKEVVNKEINKFFRNNGIREVIIEDVEEKPVIKTSEIGSIIDDIYQWISADITKEQIYYVFWAMAMQKDDDKVIEAIHKLRSDIESEIKNSEESGGRSFLDNLLTKEPEPDSTVVK